MSSQIFCPSKHKLNGKFSTKIISVFLYFILKLHGYFFFDNFNIETLVLNYPKPFFYQSCYRLYLCLSLFS